MRVLPALHNEAVVIACFSFLCHEWKKENNYHQRLCRCGESMLLYLEQRTALLESLESGTLLSCSEAVTIISMSGSLRSSQS